MLKKIKGNSNVSDIPVILLTSKSEVENRLEGLRKGADAFLAKPFNMEELHILIDNLVDNVRRIRGKYSGAQGQKAKIEQIQVKGNNDALMERVMKYMNEHLADPDLNVEKLTEDVGISRAQLHRKLKEIAGVSAGEFIRNLRLEQAARLIEEGQINITQVAYSVGFLQYSRNTMACHQVNMLKQRGMRNKQQIKENKVFFCIFAAETIIIQTNNLQRYEEIPYFIIYGTYITPCFCTE